MDEKKNARRKTYGKNGYEVEIYEGIYSWIGCYQGKDGELYQKWGRDQIGRDAFSDKSRPQKIVFGPIEEYITTLQTELARALGEVKERTPEAHESRDQDKETDAPF